MTHPVKLPLKSDSGFLTIWNQVHEILEYDTLKFRFKKSF